MLILFHGGLLIGVGKNYNFIKKVKGNVMILYDFLHNENSVYPKAWVVRFGFFLDGLPKLKSKPKIKDG